MSRSFLAVAVVAASLGAAIPALAQQSDCAGFKWPVDEETAAFSSDGLATVASGSPLPALTQAAPLTLPKQESVTFAKAPAHKPKHDPAYAGVFPIPPITAPGTYQVTISDDAWIDVVQNGKVLKQTGFTGSHTCKIVHKSVRFDLANGPATIEISDAPAETLKLEMSPAHP